MYCKQIKKVVFSLMSHIRQNLAIDINTEDIASLLIFVGHPCVYYEKCILLLFARRA